MRFHSVLLACLLTGATLSAADDPFVGTRVYNGKKSPKPTIRYTVKDLGGGRYALTGSTGQTTEIKADGVAIKSTSDPGKIIIEPNGEDGLSFSSATHERRVDMKFDGKMYAETGSDVAKAR